jgi:hypothetical protein
MPARIPWMTGVDRQILDWMHEKDVVIKPRLLRANLVRDYGAESAPSYSHTVKRMRYLREAAGLLETYGDNPNQIVISDLGKRWKRDELTDVERRALIRAGDADPP